MHIRNPPKCRMSISIIMSLIMTLLVFQCNELAAPAEGPRLQKCRLGQPICRGDAAPSRLLAHGKQPTRRSLDPRAPRSLAKTGVVAARLWSPTSSPRRPRAPVAGSDGWGNPFIAGTQHLAGH